MDAVQRGSLLLAAGALLVVAGLFVLHWVLPVAVGAVLAALGVGTFTIKVLDDH